MGVRACELEIDVNTLDYVHCACRSIGYKVLLIVVTDSIGFYSLLLIVLLLIY